VRETKLKHPLGQWCMKEDLRFPLGSMIVYFHISEQEYVGCGSSIVRALVV